MTKNNINEVKYRKYLEGPDDKAKGYVKTIVENLVYIKTDELIEMVRRSVRKFTEGNKKYNLYIPGGKIGSEHFLMVKLKDELKPVRVIRGDEKVDNDYPILILDDAIYSSCNMCGVIEGCGASYKNKIYVAVGVLSTRDVQLLNERDFFNAEVIADRVYHELLPENLFTDYDSQHSVVNQEE